MKYIINYINKDEYSKQSTKWTRTQKPPHQVRIRCLEIQNQNQLQVLKKATLIRQKNLLQLLRVRLARNDLSYFDLINKRRVIV